MASRSVFRRAVRQFSSKTLGEGPQTGHGPESEKLWRNVTLFVALPSIAIAMVNSYLKELEEHERPRPEFIPYDHMYIRNKPFPWGDGNHTLFHNPRVNPLPTGYETDDPHH